MKSACVVELALLHLGHYKDKDMPRLTHSYKKEERNVDQSCQLNYSSQWHPEAESLADLQTHEEVQSRTTDLEIRTF